MLPWVSHVSSFSGNKVKLYLHHYGTTAYYDKTKIFFFLFYPNASWDKQGFFVWEFGFEFVLFVAFFFFLILLSLFFVVGGVFLVCGGFFWVFFVIS